ncbi:metal ABC transporter solute-binding protein, Zn/Mn family [Pseudonocardia oroxyli]|uniref:Zinc/manganese transport system substrate-binding protein n=1 Tax=Pseudonocardia oroxyli TaxID=366584 RepID=A0A1G7PB52_PSEOR|nr:zinc ABC transporter substrate-binding protein [Pseudonocardia oroxyli]SDF83513.1 zinc/manganese transport system substrate-binding protein [Pseudonocardia oroxyli]
MRTRVPTTLLAVTALFGLAACGSSTDTAAPAEAAKPVVVASTDVYGSIATAVGGDLVEVRSIIDSPSADPHEYEATPADAAAVARAAIVVKNGGGYDSFADRLVASAGTNPTVIDAVTLSGLEGAEEETHAGESPEEHAEHAHGEFNEHVWYDLGTVRTVANQLATDLGAKDAAHAATYTANAQAFGADLDALQQKVDAIKATHDGQAIAVTEPVPLYLTDAAGLRNITPEAFSEAVEEGNDPAAAVLAETLQVVPTAKVVVSNSQTESASTQEVERAATAANVPVVPFSETLPDGVDSYVAWQTGQLDALTGALNRAA